MRRGGASGFVVRWNDFRSPQKSEAQKETFACANRGEICPQYASTVAEAMVGRPSSRLAIRAVALANSGSTWFLNRLSRRRTLTSAIKPPSARPKTGSLAMIHFGGNIEAILSRFSVVSPSFPRLRRSARSPAPRNSNHAAADPASGASPLIPTVTPGWSEPCNLAAESAREGSGPIWEGGCALLRWRREQLRDLRVSSF